MFPWLGTGTQFSNTLNFIDIAFAESKVKETIWYGTKMVDFCAPKWRYGKKCNNILTESSDIFC